MNVKNAFIELQKYIQEGEQMCCPYPVLRGAEQGLAVFTVLARKNEDGEVIYGILRIVENIGGEIRRKVCNQFFRPEEYIYISSGRRKSTELIREDYQNYFMLLEKWFDEPDENREQLASIFMQLVPEKALSLYQTICPEFLQELQQ